MSVIITAFPDLLMNVDGTTLVYALKDEDTEGSGSIEDTEGMLDDLSTVAAIEQNIPVRDIEIGAYKKEIMIDETVDITAKVIPGNATEQEITYWSTDEDVATVDSKGQIKGVGIGKATIVLQAGQREKSLKITVLGAKTGSITLNKDYLVLRPGATFQITAQVTPANAIQKLSYKSWNTKIVTVSKSGTLNAVGTGSTFIIVSNGDMTTSVSVIVNKVSVSGSRDAKSSEEKKKKGAEKKDEDGVDADVISEIIESDVGVVVSQEKYPVISKAVLKALSKQEVLMTVDAGEYTLVIDGANIINPENELSTQIDFVNRSNGISFSVNNGRNMPGKVALTLKIATNKSYLYLYSEAKEMYQQLDRGTDAVLMLDEAGNYLLSDEKMSTMTLKVKWVIGAGVIILIGIIAFITIRKKYWFW
jgi:hypothetical protein